MAYYKKNDNNNSVDDSIKYSVNIFSLIESHPETMGVVIAMLLGSLWFYKYKRKKRADASFGFYPQLLLNLRSLRTFLEERNWLEVVDISKGNIYTLLYHIDTIKVVAPAFSAPDDIALDGIKKITSDLKSTIHGTENNVHPKGSDKKQWYDSQQIIFDFCNFIDQNGARGKITMPQNEKNEYKHIKKCRELISAMEYIEQSIEDAQN